MRQHNATGDSRKCWRTARERERIRARFSIRERVRSLHLLQEDVPQQPRSHHDNINDEHHDHHHLFSNSKEHKDDENAEEIKYHNSNSSKVSSSLPSSLSSLLSNDNDSSVQNILSKIHTGDRSAFSISFLEKNIKLLSQLIPTTTIYHNNNNLLPKQQIISWFGHEYYHNLENYIKSLSRISFIEYTTLLGRYHILASFTLGGVNPCIRGDKITTGNQNEIATTNHTTTTTSTNSATSANDDRNSYFSVQFEQIGTRILQMYFDKIVPLSLSSYIMKRVVDMRMESFLQQQKQKQKQQQKQQQENQAQKNAELLEKNTETMFLNNCNRDESGSDYFGCSLCQQQNIPTTFQLNFGLPCFHTLCEICFWKDILQHLCDRTDDDVVLCPCCSLQRDLSYNYKSQQQQQQQSTYNKKNNKKNSTIAVDKPSITTTYVAAHHHQTKSNYALGLKRKEEKKEEAEKEDDIIIATRPFTGDGTNTATSSSSIQKAPTLLSSSALPSSSPMMKYQKSLQKYLALPLDTKELKYKKRNKKKKKVSDKDLLCSSWSKAIVPSLGLSQSVRRDKFFGFLERKSCTPHYIRSCLEAGIDINLQNEYGQTALYIAAWKNNKAVVKLLLDYGANVHIEANGGLTVEGVCGANQHYDILHMIKSRQSNTPNKSHYYNNNKNDSNHNNNENKKNENTGKINTSASFEDNHNNEFSPDSDADVESCNNDREGSTTSSKENFYFQSQPFLNTLIHPDVDHPGAGSYVIDNVFSEWIIDELLNLWKKLPVEGKSSILVESISSPKPQSLSQSQQKQRERKEIDDNSSSSRKTRKYHLCSERSYYCDAEGFLRTILTEALRRAGLLAVSESKSALFGVSKSLTKAVVWPHLRFLNYSRPGAILAPHIDLCRVDPYTGDRSTHSFLLYLSDCDHGGETKLLDNVSGDGRSIILAQVQPKRGRLLLFPHICPHEGNIVEAVPKILIRGEVRLSS